MIFIYVFFVVNINPDGLLLTFNQGDFTWSSLSGRSVRLTPVDIQSLSELERARLQEVAYTRLYQDYDLGCQITMPKGERTCALYTIFMCVSSGRLGFTAAAVRMWHLFDFLQWKNTSVSDPVTVANDAHLVLWVQVWSFVQLLSSVP